MDENILVIRQTIAFYYVYKNTDSCLLLEHCFFWYGIVFNVDFVLVVYIVS